ncbi:cytochrome P450 [Nemania sp. NC0429]|nr:cytochrome P450 [Nemania sp. NC0429]
MSYQPYCVLLLSPLYHHFHGPRPAANTTAKSKAGLRTFGSSEVSGESSKSDRPVHSPAKYMADLVPWTSLPVYDDSGALLLAGSTTGPVLILLLYCLARWPEHAKKIGQELRNLDYNDMMVLSALSYLTAMINESLRLFLAGPTFRSRQTPPEGLDCDGVHIPGDVKVIAPRYSLGRFEEAYKTPHDSIPERWYSKPELIKDKRAFAPFAMGTLSFT